MSIEDKISILKSLAAVDAELVVLQKDLSEKKTGMKEQAAHREELAERASQLDESIRVMESTRGELVGELRQTALLVDKSREKMSRCRNEREANAVQRELEELRRVYREREQEIQKLIGLIDEARTDLERVDAEKAEITSQIDESQGAVATEVKELEKEISEKEAARTALEKDAPALLLRRYESVKKRRGSALASAVKGSCTACNISLPPMLFQQIMQQRELLDCPSCHRILYYPTAKEPAADSESDETTQATSPPRN